MGIEKTINESTVLNEDYNKSFPQWFVNRLNNNSYLRRQFVSRVDASRAIFHDGEYVSNKNDDNLMGVYLIDGILYIKGFNDDDSIYVNGRQRKLGKIGPGALRSMADQYGYIDMNVAENSTYGIKTKRADDKKGSINRASKGQYKEIDFSNHRYGKYADEYNLDDLGITWTTPRGQDKSGYAVDPKALIKRLNELNAKDPARIVSKYVNMINSMKKEVIRAMNDVDILQPEDNGGYRAFDLIELATNDIKYAIQALQTLDSNLKKYQAVDDNSDEYLKYDKERYLKGSYGLQRDIDQLKDRVDEANKCVKRLNSIKVESMLESFALTEDLDDEAKQLILDGKEYLETDALDDFFYYLWHISHIKASTVYSIREYLLQAGVNLEDVETDYIFYDDGTRIPRDVKRVVIDSSVTEIPGDFCRYRGSLRSLYMPDSVVSVGDAAFYGSGLVEVRFSKNLSHIGDSAFSGTNLTGDIDLQGIDTVESHAFYRTDISSIKIGSNCTTLASQAFSYMQNLKTINIPESVKTMGRNMFNGCKNVTVYTANEKQQLFLKQTSDNNKMRVIVDKTMAG